jgi:hypothetical protein
MRETVFMSASTGKLPPYRRRRRRHLPHTIPSTFVQAAVRLLRLLRPFTETCKKPGFLQRGLLPDAACRSLYAGGSSGYCCYCYQDTIAFQDIIRHGSGH